jgi:membrane protein DedA with SNARE-associated domain
MEQFIEQLIEQAPYLGVVGVILLSGLGLPVPEDIPLLAGGYLCGIGEANIYIMLPASFTALMTADLMLYFLGRRYGQRITAWPLFRRFLDPAHLQRAEKVFHKHGGKALFIVRFMPGVRAATFFTAGTFRIPVWKMIVFDGGAALLSAPTLVLVGYFGHEYIEAVRETAAEVQIIVTITAVALAACFIWWKVRRHRRQVARMRAELEAEGGKTAQSPAKVKPQNV